MDLKLEYGNLALSENGLPQTVSGLEEQLQNVKLRLDMPKGSFLYDPGLGSGLWELDPGLEHGEERALALANEALLSLPGIRAVRAEIKENELRFTISTPLGEGEICYGEQNRDL